MVDFYIFPVLISLRHPQVEVSITREMPKVGKERKDEAEMKGTVYSRQINRS